MIDNHPEWYRIISIKPDDDTIVKSRAARDAFHDLLVGGANLDKELIVASCSLAICDFAGIAAEERLYAEVLKVACESQPSFPQHKSDNALEVRILAASAIDSLLRSDNASDELLNQAKLLAASALMAAAHLRKLSKDKRLVSMLNGMLSVASSVLHDKAVDARRRRLIDDSAIKTMEASDTATVAKELLPWLQSVIKQLNAQAQLDREEIEMLWFAISGFSKLANRRFADLPAGIAAPFCALEIINSTTFPPLASVESLISKVIASEREATDLDEKKLSDYVGSWDDETWSSLASQIRSEAQLTKSFPTILPLSWLVNRNRESSGETEWKKEFVNQTSISHNRMLSPVSLAKQFINELTIMHFYGVDESEGK